MKKLEKLLKIVDLTHLFRAVERAVYYPNTDLKENDAEHSFQLAFVGWYIANSTGADLDTNRIVKYALCHDLVEAYAGDVLFYASDEARKKKEEDEKVAQERLVHEFPEFSDLHEYIEQYEARADKESRFVYALDKILPVLNIYLDDGRLWHEHKITLDMLRDKKEDKVALSPEIQGYFEEIIDLLETKPHLFPNQEKTSEVGS